MERRFNFEGPRIEGIGIIVLVLLLITGVMVFFGVGKINVGYVAVVVDPVFGTTNVVGTGGNAQYFIKAPWASVYKIYVATDSIHMWSDAIEAGDFPAVESLTKDGLKVDVDLTVRWSLSPSSAGELFVHYPGLDWKDRAIVPIIRETVRNLLVDYSAIETIEERGAIGVVLKTNMETALAAETTLGDTVILDAVNIRKIGLPDIFVNSIEKKLAAEQLSIAAEFNKTRLLVIANATAQSAIVEAQGLADSRLLLADSTRQSIELIAQSSPELDPEELAMLYLYLETLRDIAEVGNSQFLIVPDENQYILSVPQSP